MMIIIKYLDCCVLYEWTSIVTKRVSVLLFFVIFS